MSTTRVIETRRVSFDEVLANLPKHYAGEGDLIMSHVLANLSAVFPEGEDFFVRSVRHFRDDIDDPVLRKQVAGFIGQEALHGREHRAFSLRLTSPKPEIYRVYYGMKISEVVL
jgi:predicted metal-dependent hydrolase